MPETLETHNCQIPQLGIEDALRLYDLAYRGVEVSYDGKQRHPLALSVAGYLLEQGHPDGEAMVTDAYRNWYDEASVRDDRPAEAALDTLRAAYGLWKGHEPHGMERLAWAYDRVTEYQPFKNTLRYCDGQSEPGDKEDELIATLDMVLRVLEPLSVLYENGFGVKEDMQHGMERYLELLGQLGTLAPYLTPVIYRNVEVFHTGQFDLYPELNIDKATTQTLEILAKNYKRCSSLGRAAALQAVCELAEADPANKKYQRLKRRNNRESRIMSLFMPDRVTTEEFEAMWRASRGTIYDPQLISDTIDMMARQVLKD